MTEEVSLSQRLRDLGFVPTPGFPKPGDFVLQNDGDGRGTYIREWLSEEPCPFPELIREPFVAPVADGDAP